MKTTLRKKSVDRREEIVKAVLSIIGERGITALTTTTLASEVGVTLCYARRRTDAWPFNLYCMVHARRREDALAVIDRLNNIAGKAAGAKPRDHAVLFSTRCYKQTGAKLSPRLSAVA